MKGIQKMEKINILICSDKNYLMPTTVLLRSLYDNNHEVNNVKYSFDVYILNSDLSEDDINSLKNKNLQEMNIISLKVNEEDFKDLKVSGHISKSAYYRILASEILPKDITRILYLDCDIIINGSIIDLYNHDLSGSFIAAAEDKVVSHKDIEVYDNLKFDMQDKYFNSGVILFNLEDIRKIDNFKQRIFSYIKENDSTFKFHDQDILNGFFKDKVSFVDDFKYNNLVKWLQNKSDLKRAYEEAVILHFADKWKPWKSDYIGYMDEIFWKYAVACGYENLYKKYKKKHFIRSFVPFNILRKIKREFWR